MQWQDVKKLSDTELHKMVMDAFVQAVPVIHPPTHENQDIRNNSPTGLIYEAYLTKAWEVVNLRKELDKYKDMAINARKELSDFKRKSMEQAGPEAVCKTVSTGSIPAMFSRFIKWIKALIVL